MFICQDCALLRACIYMYVCMYNAHKCEHHVMKFLNIILLLISELCIKCCGIHFWDFVNSCMQLHCVPPCRTVLLLNKRREHF